MAEFEGVATVPVHKRNPFTLSGSVPSSDQPRDVPVRVVTQTGQCLGMTHFQYVEEMHDMARQLVHDPAKQALWFAILLEEYGFFGFDSDLAQVLDPLDMQCQGLSEEKSSDDSSENNSDTDYFADVETSSIDSLGYQTLSRSTSEDNISKLYSKEQMKASTHQSISSIGKGAFARNGIMLKTGQIREGVQRKSYVLILRDSHFDSSLPEVVKGLDYTLAFHLAMGSTSIPRQLHTANESFLALRGSRKAQPIIFFCEWHLSLDVLLEGSLVKNNNDHISRAVATKQHCCNQLNEGILAELRTQIPVEKAIPVDWKSSDISVKQSGVHTHRDLWVFTSAFRPTRKTLFVYFADRRDDLPPSNFFEDEDCESQIRCWKWKRSGNNSFKFTETLKAGKLLPGGGKSQMESHTDLPVTYIVRDKQAQTQSESGTCLSWMHAMMHHCWTTESTEKASNITIFDRFLGPLGTDLMMSSGSRNDDSNKEKVNICQPVVSSGVGNTKINHEKWGMVESVFIDQTNCKIKGNEAKETNVEADSSKTERRTDAGKSLPAYTVDDCEAALRFIYTRPLGTDLMMSSGSRNDDSNKEKVNICQPVVSSGVGNTKINHEKWGMVESVFIDQTNCKIKGNEAKETNVEADSSKTERRTDAGKSLPAYTVDDCEAALRFIYTRHLGMQIGLLYKQLEGLLRTSDSDSATYKLHETEGKAHVSKAKTSKENFAKCTRDASFSGDLTDSTVKVNIGEETKVQADSSNTQRTVDARKSLPAFAIGNCKDKGPPASALRPLRTDLLMSSGSTHGDSNKGKLNICKPVVASCVGNTKVNCEKYGMVKSIFSDDDTDCKIKGNEAKETKIQADSSKTETTIDAGKSLYPLAIERSEIASDTITSLKSRIERVRLACKMSCLDRVFGVLDQSDSSSSDISGIIEGNPYGNMTICTFDDLPVWSFGEKFRFIVIDHRSDSSSRRDISRIIEGNPYGNMTQGTSGIIEGNPYGNMTIGTFDDLPVGSFAETVMVIVIDRSDSSSRRDISRIIEGNPYENMMEGTFDDLLVWPFAGTVTVSVIDRSGSRASSNISRIIQAKPNVFCLPTAP
ncbi:uncharacterized protein [Montipora foliosa]|uniref:uncharacterized protein isoform X2 n=1 Tax=Montipora foliosa TaxID=591990 RepID=UPI0035F17FFF